MSIGKNTLKSFNYWLENKDKKPKHIIEHLVVYSDGSSTIRLYELNEDGTKTPYMLPKNYKKWPLEE